MLHIGVPGNGVAALPNLRLWHVRPSRSGPVSNNWGMGNSAVSFIMSEKIHSALLGAGPGALEFGTESNNALRRESPPNMSVPVALAVNADDFISKLTAS